MTSSSASPPASLALLLLCACTENPFARPLTFVDGRGFPPELRGVIAPRTAFVDGKQVAYFLLGRATPAVATATELRGASGEDLPACRGPGRDGTGHFADAVLADCQGRLLGTLPGAPGYTPFVRLLEARMPAGYRPGDVRSLDALGERGIAAMPSARVLDLVLVDPDTTVSDPTGRTQRLVAFYQGLGVVALQLPGEVPLDEAGAVTPMDLLVPEGHAPGEGGDVLAARAGSPGYSPLCRVVHFRTAPDFRPGDITASAMVAEVDRRVDEPATLVHCAAP